MHEDDEFLAAATGNRYYGVGGLRAFGAFFKNYVNFTGRSTRREYWWFQLWNILITWGVMLILLVSLFGSIGQLLSGSTGDLHGGQVALMIGSLLVIFVYALATIIPGIALSVRRFRDAGVHWGIYLLLQVLAVAGSIWNAVDDSNLIGALLIVAVSLTEFVITVLPSKNPPHQEEQQTLYH
ncbi:DUF805 domain-containing protein [Lacticaseibacillus sp. GG6-2]